MVSLRRLELQQEVRELVIPPEAVHQTLMAMRRTLKSGNLPAKRDLLSKVVAKIEMGPTSAELSYTFPLHEMTGICTALPRDTFQSPTEIGEPPIACNRGEPGYGPAFFVGPARISNPRCLGRRPR